MELLKLKSKLDQTIQESIFISASGNNRPLLVALHTWSFDKENQLQFLLPYVEREDYNLLLPNFRGPNKRFNKEHKKACGSPFAISDIIEATEFVLKNKNVDNSNIFLFGGSGGGQAALLAQARAPELWTKTIAYVPVLDLKMWLGENVEKNTDFVDDMLACLGDYIDNKTEYYVRSPMNHVEEIVKARNLKIYIGKHDEIVSVEQGIEFFKRINDYSTNCNVYFDFFDGGHYVNYDQVIRYFNDTEQNGMIDLTK